MATTTPSSRLDHLKICMDCSGEGTRHVTDSGKGSLPIRRTVTCARGLGCNTCFSHVALVSRFCERLARGSFFNQRLLRVLALQGFGFQRRLGARHP